MGRGVRPGASLTSPLPLNLAPAARLCSAGMLPPPCLSSTTMGPYPVLATRWVPQAPHVNPSGASVPAGATSLAVTAPAAPPATGASPSADVSNQCSEHRAKCAEPLGLPGEWGCTRIRGHGDQGSFLEPSRLARSLPACAPLLKGPRKQQVASSSDSGSLIVHGKGAV